MHAFSNKFERTVPPAASGNRSIVLHGIKLDEIIDVDRSFRLKES